MSDADGATTRRLRVLVVSPMAVWPPIHGGGVRITSLLRRLAERHDVSLLLVAGGTDAPEHRDALVPPCREVLVHPAGGPADLDGAGRWPEMARPFASRALADRIGALVHGRGFDVVQLEFTQLGGLVEAARPARVVLVEHDLSWRSHRRRRAQTGAGAPVPSADDDLGRLERFELEACRRADQVHVMSETDRLELATRLGGRGDHVVVVPNGVDARSFAPPADARDRSGVLLLGSFPHPPNLDAFDWTVAEVWPEIRRRLPAATLTVAGARPPDRVLELDGRDGIRVAGEVDDVRPLLAGHRVLLVPLRSGSGTRLKILEAMACGLPVVSTTIGAEGLPVADRQHLLLADTPSALADATVELLHDDPLAATLGAAGRTLVADRFDWDGIAVTVDELWRSMADPERKGSGAPAPAPAGRSPRVAVAVPVLDGGSPWRAACEGVERQRVDGVVDRILVDARETPSGSLERMGWRVVRPTATGRLGPALDGAVHATRAPAIAFLAAVATPADERWLDRLLAPLEAERAPAAVQGAMWDQATEGGVRVDRSWTAERRRWRREHGGFELDPANAAVRRDVWERAPFGPWDRLVGLRWQRVAAACGWLILPCWDAAVIRVLPAGWRSRWRDGVRSGRELAAMGLRYTLGDAASDLLRPFPLPHRRGWPAVLRAAARRTPVFGSALLRPLALLAGSSSGRRDYNERP